MSAAMKQPQPSETHIQRIEAQEAEIERLRAALQAVVDHGNANGMQEWKVMRMARNALNHEQKSDGQ